MRKIIIALSLLLITGICFGQKKDNKLQAPKDTLSKSDSLNMPIVSMAELNQYLIRINLVAMKQFDLTQQAKHQEILKELQAILVEVEKKSKRK